jgi:hypothetical protein
LSQVSLKSYGFIYKLFSEIDCIDPSPPVRFPCLLDTRGGYSSNL